MLSAGTVLTNRKKLPKAQLLSGKEMKRGDVECFQAKNIFFVKWMDNKAVHMLSNFLTAFPWYEIKRKKAEPLKKTTLIALPL